MNFRQAIEANIEEHGFHMMGVFGTVEDPGPSFTYTIGLEPRFGFELIVLALPIRYSGGLMHMLYQRLLAGEQFELNKDIDVGFNMPLRMQVAGDEARKYVVQADHYYGKPVQVRQLVMPDKDGKFPEDEGFDHAFMSARQPLLYGTQSPLH